MLAWYAVFITQGPAEAPTPSESSPHLHQGLTEASEFDFECYTEGTPSNYGSGDDSNPI